MGDVELKQLIGGLLFKHPVVAAAGPNVELPRVREAAQMQGFPITKTICVQACSPPIQNMAYLPGKPKLAFLNKEGHSEYSVDDWVVVLKDMSDAGLAPIASVGYMPEDIRIIIRKLQKIVAGWEVSTHYTTSEQSQDVVRLLVATAKPVFLKISPNSFISGSDDQRYETKLEDYVKMFQDLRVTGFVGINSLGPTNLRYPDTHQLAGARVLGGNAWLSGPRIKRIGLTFISKISEITQHILPIGGVGGIESYKDVLAYMAAGADFVGVCTAAILEGPGIYTKIANDLEIFMKNNNYSTIDELKFDLRRRSDELFSAERMGNEHKAFETWSEMIRYAQEQKGEILETHKDFSFTSNPILNQESCIECNPCSSETACTRKAFNHDRSSSPQLSVDPHSCCSCYLCVDVCKDPKRKTVQRPAEVTKEMTSLTDG